MASVTAPHAIDRRLGGVSVVAAAVVGMTLGSRPVAAGAVLVGLAAAAVAFAQPVHRLLFLLCAVLGFTVWQVDIGVDVDLWRVGFVAVVAHYVLVRASTASPGRPAVVPEELRGLLVVGALAASVAGLTIPELRGPAPEPVLAVVRWAMVFYWYALLRRYLVGPDRARRAATFLLGGAVVLAAYGLLQFLSIYAGSPLPYAYGPGRSVAITTFVADLPRVGSLAKEPRDLAMHLVPAATALVVLVASPSLARDRRRHVLALTIAMLGLLVTFSRAYLVFFGVGLLVAVPACWIATRQHRRPLRRTLLAMAAAALTVLTLVTVIGPFSIATVGSVVASSREAFDPETYQPAALVREEAVMFAESPFLGVGPGNASRVFVARRGDVFGEATFNPISWYLATLAEVGVVGFALLVVFLGRTLRRLVRSVRDAVGHPDRAWATAMLAGTAVLLVAHAYEPGPSPLTFAYLAIAESLACRSGVADGVPVLKTTASS